MGFCTTKRVVESLKTFFCTINSCHFNFDPGKLLWFYKHGLRALELSLWKSTLYTTGAQEWHIVSLIGDVNSPTIVAHYVSVTSDLRVLSTEKHWVPRRKHTVYTNKRLECKGKYIVRHWTSREASLLHSRSWGTEAFPLSSVICAPVLYTLQ